MDLSPNCKRRWRQTSVTHHVPTIGQILESNTDLESSHRALSDPPIKVTSLIENKRNSGPGTFFTYLQNRFIFSVPIILASTVVQLILVNMPNHWSNASTAECCLCAPGTSRTVWCASCPGCRRWATKCPPATAETAACARTRTWERKVISALEMWGLSCFLRPYIAQHVQKYREKTHVIYCTWIVFHPRRSCACPRRTAAVRRQKSIVRSRQFASAYSATACTLLPVRWRWCRPHASAAPESPSETGPVVPMCENNADI